MSIVDELVENLIERNAIKLNGTLTLQLVDGGVTIKGTIASTLRDQKRNKDLVRANIPVDAGVKIADIVIPVPNIK